MTSNDEVFLLKTTTFELEKLRKIDQFLLEYHPYPSRSEFIRGAVHWFMEGPLLGILKQRFGKQYDETIAGMKLLIFDTSNSCQYSPISQPTSPNMVKKEPKTPREDLLKARIIRENNLNRCCICQNVIKEKEIHYTSDQKRICNMCRNKDLSSVPVEVLK